MTVKGRQSQAYEDTKAGMSGTSEETVGIMDRWRTSCKGFLVGSEFLRMQLQDVVSKQLCVSMRCPFECVC
jgi:hypothetical protein